MTTLVSRIDQRSAVHSILLALIACVAGLLVAYLPLLVSFAVIGALIVAAIAFLRTELVLHLLILSMLLSPEIALGGGGGGAGVEGSKAAMIRIEDLLLVIIGFTWLAKMAVYKQLGVALRTPLNWPIALYGAILLTSTILGMGAGRVSPVTGTLFTGKYLEYFIIYVIVINHCHDRQVLKRMLITATITAILVAAVAIIQIPGGGRVSAPFEGERGEPNTLGGYLVLMMSILGGMALEAPLRKHRIALGAIVALLGIPLLYTLSRSSWIAALAAAPLLVMMTNQRKRLMGVLLAAGLVVAICMPADVAKRVAYTFKPHRTSVQVGAVALDSSTSERVRSWGETLEDSTKHPLLGYGVTGYHFIDAQYFRILIESGVLGLGAFILLISMLLKHSIKAARELSSPYLRGMTAGFVAAVGALLVHGIGSNTFIIIRIMEPFWLFAGLVAVAPLIEKAGKARHEPG